MISFLLVIVIVATIIAIVESGVVVDRTLPPFFFLPGYGASNLYAIVSSAEYIPLSCAASGIGINERIAITKNASLIKNFPDCVDDLMLLEYRSADQTFHFPQGVTVETDKNGPFTGITQNYWGFGKELETWGYKSEVNMYAVPYDYRFMSATSFEQLGFVTKLMAEIEQAYLHNGKRRVIVAGHSNGGPTMYSFFISKLVPYAWKQKYVAAMISLSGNMLGQMNCIYDAVKPINHFLNTTWTWEGNYGSLPWGGYDLVKDIPIVTTFYQTAQEKNYTAQLDSLQDMFNHAGRADWAERIGGIYAQNMMNRTAHPLVNTYCLYGSNMSTSYSFIFEKDIQQTEASKILYMEGDDNQDIIDNQFCNIWQQDTRIEAKQLVFESQAFPNVGHMEMVSDTAVFSKIKQIVDLYTVA